MCEISVVNLGEYLNKKLFLLMGTMGSFEHKDGWGFADKNGELWKCAIPMHFTSNSGEVLRTRLPESDGITLGHIRRASPEVPVVQKNSHPFSKEDITFVHNGKLSPKDDVGFILEEEVLDLDKDGKEQFEKDGSKKMKKVKRSDSLIFFEKFAENWKADVLPGNDIDESFVSVLKKTMGLFYGKFAMVFIIQGRFYVVRGKTANLYISYLRATENPDSDILGWAINTNDITLRESLTLLSNLRQLDGEEKLYFSYPTPLKQECIFLAEETGLKELGTILEGTAPVKTYGYDYSKTSTAANTAKKYNTKSDRFDVLKQEVFEFLKAYSLHPNDLSVIFMLGYGLPLHRISEGVLEHFVSEVIPLLSNATNKKTRKAIKAALLDNPVRFFRYKDGINYPWMLNPKADQIEFVKSLQGK